MIYNDAYSRFSGTRHPGLLGRNVREAWPEVADFNDHVLKVVLHKGQTLSYKDQELSLNRDGVFRQLWADLDYSPVFDEVGRPVGVFVVVTETTERVLADRRIAAERERQHQLLGQMPGFVSVMSGPEHIYEYVNEAYLAISDRTDFIGKTVRQMFPELEGQGYFELLDQVYSTGKAVVTRAMELRLQGSDDVQFIDFVYQPIRDADGSVTGIFVGGYEVTEAHRAAAAIARE
jgi:PAS domain S-box-containing protein